MREMGVRELKQTLSETLKAVGRGQQVRVTVRGRPVADIVPAGTAPAKDRLLELASEGRLATPSRPRPKRAPRLVHNAESASSHVLSERDAER
jgi:prevent-host-death family protein